MWTLLLPNGILITISICLTIDKAGRMIFPKGIRVGLHLEPGDLLDAEVGVDELVRLMEAMKIVTEKSMLDASSLIEAIKATGVAGVVARAASAGLLPATMVTLLASTPALIWIGTLGGAVGAIVGACTLKFFQKVKLPVGAKTKPDKE